MSTIIQTFPCCRALRDFANKECSLTLKKIFRVAIAYFLGLIPALIIDCLYYLPLKIYKDHKIFELNNEYLKSFIRANNLKKTTPEELARLLLLKYILLPSERYK